MYEVTTLDKVKNPQKSTISWDPDFSIYTWYAEQDEANNQTIIYANFHEKDPNKENVEISVRRNCFYPESEGIGYITLSGFRISQAATQWAPPTAYQEGMVGPHWSNRTLSPVHHRWIFHWKGRSARTGMRFSFFVAHTGHRLLFSESRRSKALLYSVPDMWSSFRHSRSAP